jgi:hypothetical protein
VAVPLTAGGEINAGSLLSLKPPHRLAAHRADSLLRPSGSLKLRAILVYGRVDFRTIISRLSRRLFTDPCSPGPPPKNVIHIAYSK